MVVILLKPDINISSTYVNSGSTPKCLDLLFISLICLKLTSWQDMLSLPLEGSTPSFVLVFWRVKLKFVGFMRV